MKFGKNYITILFCLLSVINIAIFFYRDKFAFHKYGTISSLYSADTAKWKKFIGDYPKQELDEAKTILDSLHLERQSTASKILNIGKLLYSRFYRQAGQPSTQLLTASPLNQFKILSSSDTVKLWCGNFANMFAFFCWSEGIPCRVTEIMNPGDHHVLNEFFVAEKGTWAVADVTNNNLLLLNKNKNGYADLLSVRDSLSTPLFVLQAIDSSIDTRPFSAGFYDKYFGNENPINYYYHTNNLKVYRTSEKIKRYFLPVPWYEELDKTPKGNLLFYVKQLFILLWLISFILLARQFISPKFRSFL